MLALKQTEVSTQGNTPSEITLFEYIKRKDKDALTRFIENERASIDVRDVNGQTPLHLAAALCWFEGCQILLDGGANRYAKDHQGQYPFTYAVKNYRTQLFELFVGRFDAVVRKFASTNGKEKTQAIRELNNYLHGWPFLISSSIESLLIKALESEDQSVQLETLEVLYNNTDPSTEIIQSLLLLLKEKDSHVCKEAARILGNRANPSFEVIQALLQREKYKNSPEYEYRYISSEKVDIVLGNFSNINAKVIRDLLLLLNDEDDFVRKAIVNTLGNLANPSFEVIQALLPLKQDKNSSVRLATIKTLCKFTKSHPEIAQDLLPLLNDEDNAVRELITNMLINLANPSVEMIQTLLQLKHDKNSAVRLGTAKILGKFANSRPEIIQDLLSLLNDEDSAVREAVVYRLGDLTNPSFEVICAILLRTKDKQNSVCDTAKNVLAKISNLSGDSIQGLLGILTDENNPLREAVVYIPLNLTNPSLDVTRALLQLGNINPFATAQLLSKLSNPSVETIQSLLDSMKNGYWWDTDFKAANVLANVSNPSFDTIQFVSQAAKNSDWKTRRGAIVMLANLTDLNAGLKKEFVDALNDEIMSVRWAISEMMRRRITAPSSQLFPDLLQAMTNESKFVSSTASYVLCKYLFFSVKSYPDLLQAMVNKNILELQSAVKEHGQILSPVLTVIQYLSDVFSTNEIYHVMSQMLEDLVDRSLSEPNVELMEISLEIRTVTKDNAREVANALRRIESPSAKMILALLKKCCKDNAYTDLAVTEALLEGVSQISPEISPEIVPSLLQIVNRSFIMTARANALKVLCRVVNPSISLIDVMLKSFSIDFSYDLWMEALPSVSQTINHQLSLSQPTLSLSETQLLTLLAPPDPDFFRMLDHEHNNVLHIAITNHYADLVKWLLDHHTPVYPAKVKGLNALMQAVVLELPSITQILLNKFPPDALEDKNPQGETVLLIAARLANESLIMMLLDTGVDYHATNSEGRNLLQILQDKKNKNPSESHIVLLDRVTQKISQLEQTKTPNPPKSAQEIPLSQGIDLSGKITISISIPYHQLTLGKELGRGGFGIVYEGQYQFAQVAIKTLLHQELKPPHVEEFKKEAVMMASLRSPFIVSLYGICLEKPHYSLVMEYMANGSLFSYLRSEHSVSWKNRYQIGVDVGGGLAYLHSHQMLHCDLKSLNILLDINYRAKICDFGLSKVKLETSFSTVSGGSTRWMAPELFEEGAKGTKAADVYSYGIVLWELGSRTVPFATTRNEAVPVLVCRGKREEIIKDTPPKMAKLIVQCWDGIAEKRPTAEETVKELQRELASYKF